jgi:hypothetical protein
MLVEVQVSIQATRPAIWAAITDIPNAATTLSGVEQIEIVTQPPTGLVGLKWKETRILFGKPATAEKWITDAVENESYKTRAESDGFIFLSTTTITQGPNNALTLTSIHDSQPQTLATRLMSIPMTLFFKGVAQKALLQDLNDIKAAVERQPLQTQ